MSAVGWFLLADTVVTAIALVLAAIAWWRCGDYMRQARSTVQAYAPLAQAAIAERIPPVERQRQALEDTQPAIPPAPPADDRPTGRHALVDLPSDGLTDVAPAVGQLDDGETESLRIPRYYFADLDARRRAFAAGGER